LRIRCVPDFHGVDVRVDDVFEVRCESRAIDGGATTCYAHTLGDVEDDAGEAVFVKVNFLVIGNLANGAVFL
jgi:hypothetical protein